jgi:TPP-dependent pyruvate/acetoin dehydrogenase alpha subunit
MRLPDLATTGSAVSVVRWLVEPGQHVRRGEPILEVMTDKAVVELESTVTGLLREFAVQPGDEVTTGMEIATFEVGDEAEAGSFGIAASATAAATTTAHAQSGSAWTAAVIVQGLSGSNDTHRQASPKAPARGVSLLERNRQARAAKDQVPTYDPVERYGRELLLALYERMVLIREFEEGVKFLFLEGAMPGTIHQCQGQEATAVGVCAGLQEGDFITSTFRGHGHALAKGLSPEELLFELFGASTGCCRGKGGSMHVGNMDKGMVPGIAIVGGGVPLAAGMALALKMQKQPGVVVCFFGDGAVAEGAFHEGVNLAAIWDLPVVFVCENNHYGASTRVDQVMRNPRISDRAAAYGFRGETVDGNDVLAVLEATVTAVDECRDGRGPVLLELLTYRRTGHSRRDTCQYQPKDERDEWFARDPIARLGRMLLDREIANQDELEGILTRIQAQFRAAVDAARQQPMPTVDDLATDVFA